MFLQTPRDHTAGELDYFDQDEDHDDRGNSDVHAETVVAITDCEVAEAAARCPGGAAGRGRFGGFADGLSRKNISNGVLDDLLFLVAIVAGQLRIILESKAYRYLV